MKTYTIYPNFAFSVEAESEQEAQKKAVKKMIEARSILEHHSFDLVVEADE